MHVIDGRIDPSQNVCYVLGLLGGDVLEAKGLGTKKHRPSLDIPVVEICEVHTLYTSGSRPWTNCLFHTRSGVYGDAGTRDLLAKGK